VRRRSAAQPHTLRIIERLEPHRGAAQLAENVDPEARALARQRGGQVAGSEALADTMSVGAGGHVTDRGALVHDRLVADHLGVGVRYLHDDEAPFGARGALGEHGVAPRERGFVEVDEAVEPGFRRRVIGTEILVE